MGVIKQGLIKRAGGPSSFPGGEVLHPLAFSHSVGWGSLVVFSEAPRSCLLLSPPFFLLTQKLECVLSARSQLGHQRGELR